MQKDDEIDEILTQHAIFKIMNNDIIPCFCGAYRKIKQNKILESLFTHCPKCGSQGPLSLADLGFLGAGLLILASGNDIDLRPPSISYDQICQMIEDIQNYEAWVKEIEGRNLRMQFMVLKGGLSE